MSAYEREGSRDRAHTHSFSSDGRASVPIYTTILRFSRAPHGSSIESWEMKKTLLTAIKRRWDSSDPDRAPPPLPLNPTTGAPTTKANTSAGIAAAAKQIVERARESAPISSYTSNKPGDDRSLVKGAHHKRMQSLQTSPVKDLRNYLENRTPERSPERPNSRHSWMPASRMNSIEDISPTPHRATTPTPLDRSSDTLKETPTLRPTTRQRSIYGENTPPSATMLALQTMQVPEPPLNDITNGYAPTTPGAPRVNTNYDFSSQLLNLTSIATSLQKEMHQLSRRSKDNATDLLTLKEATNSRDEDIRKSLRELADTVSMTQGLLPPSGLGGSGRSTSGYSQYLDNRPFSSPPSAGKTFSLPRAASAHSFLDEPRCPGSPSPYSVEGAASVAMLEKIIREMVTKDGQDRLLTTLSEMLEKGSQENKDAKQKVEELAQFIRERSESSALVTVSTDGGSPKLELNLDSPKVHEGGGSSNDEELLRLLQRIKDSVTHSGGTTAEVKGLVRDLRGEVLGMGRELGKKMDQLGEAQLNSSLDKSIHEGKDMEHLEEVQRIVEEGLTELKQTLSSMVKERTEQDDDTFRQLAVARPGPNSDEMLAVIQHALSEHSRTTEKSPEDDPGLDRDGVLDAVKEGLKDFEPNIELQQFGLERDEILAVLKEGLEEYRNERSEPVTAQIDKAEIYEVLQEALQNFEAPYPAEQIDRLREELIANVRQALEDFKPPPVEPPVSQEAMQAAVFEAVKEGLERHGGSGPRELEISRDDLFDAVKASLDASALPFGDFGEQVLSQLKELIEGMHVEFKQYSAANGRDTEQVLDAIKDGLESLRCEIETYVDRAQDVTGKDEIVDTVKGGLEQLREDVKSFCAEGPSHDGGRAEMLEYIKAEFEQLHEAVASNASRNTDEQDASEKTAVVMVLKEGLDDLKSHLESRNEDLTSNEELNEAMKAEFEQLKGAILNANAADKTELTETIQDCLGALHAKLDGSDASASSNGATEEVIETMREELAALKESIHEMIGDNGQDAIAQSVREAIEELRTQIQSDQNNASIDALAAIKQELETFKDSISNAVVVAGSGESAAANDEALEAIRSTLDEIKETIGKPENEGISTEQLEAIRGEFENLRTTIASSVVHGGSNEEVMDAMRLGLDDLRSHLERKLDNPETVMQHQSQVLDALNEGLESLRTDIIKTLDKPLDQTVNYEILETLKDGLSDLRAEMNKLGGSKTPEPPQGGEIVLADPTLAGETRELSEDDAAAAAAAAAATAPEITKADFEKLEVLLAQLQIKIEAMDNTVQEMPTQQQPAPVPEGIALKDDLTSLEGLIRELQESVGALAEKPDVTSEGAARKEDTDAIETLLRNTKSHLEEMVLPDPATAATKEHLDEIQAVVSAANEAITGLSEKLESSTAAKADVAVVEVLANDIKTLMEEMKAASEAAKAEDVPEPITKEDVDVLGVLCTEIKTRVNEMVLPEVETLPTKADMEQLQGLLNDFRESHDKMRDSYETDIAVTAKAFDDRKKEYEETLAQIDQVKNVLGEVKTELLAKMADGDVGIDTLGVTLKAIEERSSSEDVMTEVKGVMEKLKEEFERAHSSIEAIKVDQASSADSTLEKQSEHKDAIIAGLGEKLDTAIATLISKYDDAQKVVEEKAKTMEEKTGQQEELLNTTKSMADDLKLSIDTLGMTLTSFMGDLPAQVEKMTEESKIVFTQAEATHTKLEETSEALKAENTATREEVARVLAAVDVVQSDMSEHNPRFMVTLEEVRALINQHYEHSQKASTAAEEQAQAVKELQDALKAGFEETKTTHADGLKSHHEALEKALPGLFPPPAELPPPVEKYDDAAVQEKLDKLMSHVEEANERSTQLERLDQIHEKVIATATEVSAFVAAQNKQIQEEHETKEKEAEEIALLLERRLERKDQLEADITVLNEEKESLQSAVEQLKAEKEALAAQKSRLNADVRAMETALHIRRDELHEMDNKAAMIERRMLEGVMNQSRMLLLSRSAKSPPSPTKKKPQGRDLRIPSTTSATSEQTTTSSMQPVKANHAFAMKARPGIGRNGQLPNTAERRIMSLNQITNNVPTGAHAFVDKPSPATGGLSNVKRSHSVKTNFMGKPSWAERKRLASLSSANKENQTLSEEDESMDDDTETPLEFGSDAGTERRTSYLSGEGSMSYATGSYLSGDGETPLSEDGATRRSYAPSDMTYGTGSYMTGSEADHRTSLGSASSDAGLGADRSSRHSLDSASDLSGLPRSELSTVLEQTEVSSVAPVQASGSEIEAAVREVMHDEMDPKDLSKLYAPPSDSGLGTDCPTAAESGGEGYFQ